MTCPETVPVRGRVHQPDRHPTPPRPHLRPDTTRFTTKDTAPLQTSTRTQPEPDDVTDPSGRTAEFPTWLGVVLGGVGVVLAGIAFAVAIVPVAAGMSLLSLGSKLAIAGSAFAAAFDFGVAVATVVDEFVIDFMDDTTSAVLGAMSLLMGGGSLGAAGLARGGRATNDLARAARTPLLMRESTVKGYNSSDISTTALVAAKRPPSEARVVSPPRTPTTPSPAGALELIYSMTLGGATRRTSPTSSSTGTSCSTGGICGRAP